MDYSLNLIAGKKIRKYRKLLGLSQEKLAEIANLHRTYIGSVERGERNITLDSLENIAKALKCPPIKLLTR
jgi:transcriptional regulator with XRE-family HTH domain